MELTLQKLLLIEWQVKLSQSSNQSSIQSCNLALKLLQRKKSVIGHFSLAQLSLRLNIVHRYKIQQIVPGWEQIGFQ